jgi:hypothetical protein
LEPTEVAGFNEQFDDFDGTRADWLGLGVDVRASKTVRLGAELTLRGLSQQVAFSSDTHHHATQSDDCALAYLYWTVTDQIAASLEVIGEDFSAKGRDNPSVLGVRSLTVPLQLSYFSPVGWFASVQTALVAQDVDLGSGNATQKTDLDSHGVLVDLAAGYRLPKRRGVIALELTNLLDRHLSFRDDSFRTGRAEVNPRFLPSRAFLASISLNF